MKRFYILILCLVIFAYCDDSNVAQFERLGLIVNIDVRVNHSFIDDLSVYIVTLSDSTKVVLRNVGGEGLRTNLYLYKLQSYNSYKTKKH